jgi:disulfide bond formation protein DsbB
VNALEKLGASRKFWLAGIVYLTLMEAIALYYQYGPGQWYPCALCVQVRAWVLASVFFSILGLVLVKHFWLRWMSLNLTIAMLAGALYTSYYAFGVEQGTVISSCTMGAGFPSFMPLDQWVPFFFEAQGMCGQSPAMPLGLSMVEALLVTISMPLLLLTAVWVAHIRKMIAHEV